MEAIWSNNSHHRKNTPTQCAAAKRLRAETKPLAQRTLRAEDARSATAGPAFRPEQHSWQRSAKRSDPSRKAACGIVAAAALRPRCGERSASRPQPRVQGRSPGSEGVRGVQRGLGGHLGPRVPLVRRKGKHTMQIENTSRMYKRRILTRQVPRLVFAGKYPPFHKGANSGFACVFALRAGQRIWGSTTAPPQPSGLPHPL